MVQRIPQNFFTVATETFFEKPHQLLSHDLAVYQQLQFYYHLDPVQWEMKRQMIG